jgi:hypothetical protein
MPDTHALYLRDLGQLVREAGEAAKRDAASSVDSDRQFQQGRLMTYYEVLSFMQQQALAFDLPFRDIALDGLDPDRDLF